MSQNALSEADARRSATRVSPRRDSARTSAGRRRSAAPPSPERLFRWRVLGGLLFLLLFTPFLTVSLASPEFTGHSGASVAWFLDFWLGRAAWMLPVLTLALALILFEPDPVREFHLRWGVPVLFLDLVMLAARMDDQGGRLGRFLDDVLVRGIGDFGAWLIGAAGFVAGLGLLWQVTLAEFLQGLVTLGRFLERALVATGQFLRRATLTLGRAAARTGRFLGWLSRGMFRATCSLLGRLHTPGQPPHRPSRRAQSPARNSSDEVEDLVLPAEPLPAGRRRERISLFQDSSEATSVAPEGVPEAQARAVTPTNASLEPLDPEEPDLGDFSEEETPEPVPETSIPESAEVEAAPWESSEGTPPELPTVVDVPAISLTSGTALPNRSPSCAPSQEGILEEPGGQLRLFPGPASQASAPLRYKLPPLSLLEDGPRIRRTRPVEDKSRLLVDTLESFGVQARVVNVVHGPTVTRYELQPARGVKVSRFTSLTNDIALALAAVSIRIEAPIPGKSAIGIEVPNLNTELVVLKDILGSENFRKGAGLCLGLGKDITGQAQMTDLQKMPHLLVAGTTGSGKSVCINTLILSLIYRFTPRRLQLLMVDPKQVELSIYEGLPHLVGLSGEDSGRILVDPKKAAMALKQVVDLMEDRYTQFARARVRNLKEFNDQAAEPLPWMVVIIDELADLMMVASKTVETSICRLAQKARAAGIHLVVATQRPSTDVITGLIKVNIPSRIAFAVSSGVDSRVILDTGGAENLLGKGDMLFLPVDASEPRRIQGAYVTNEEIQRVVEFWRAQAAPENRIELAVQDTGGDEATPDGDEDGSDDELVQEALQVVLRCQQASASMLQTELKVGYARARRILTILERKGYVGPAEGSKPRKILYTGGEVL